MAHSFGKVLVVTDFSETANDAVPYAFVIAGEGGEVHLVHVIEHPDVPNPLYAHYTQDDLNLPEKREALRQEVEAHLKTLIPDTGSKQVSAHVHMAFHAIVADGIVAEAKRVGAEAIVIGSHGRTGLSHLLIGSVAEQVLRQAKVPVLVVPHKKRR